MQTAHRQRLPPVQGLSFTKIPCSRRSELDRILPLFSFPCSPQLTNLSIIRELQRACAKRAGNNKKFVVAAIRRWEVNSLLVLLVIAFFAVTNFFRGDVELTFSFLLVLRFSLHAVYYAKNETSEQSLFLDARSFDSLHLSKCRLLTCGFVQKTQKTNRRANPPIRMQKSLYFQVKGPKLILRDVKKVRWLWSSRRVVTVVYGFTTPLRRQELMIEILNSSSLIVNISWQSGVG